MNKSVDRQFARSGRWALANDDLQWILQKQKYVGGPWKSISFVRSTRDILIRCMREKGCPLNDANKLIIGLPETFEQWYKEHHSDAGDDVGEL